MGYIPLRETESPRTFKWARRMFIAGLVLFVLTLLAELFGLIDEGSITYGIAIVAIASGLFLYWEVG